MKKSLLRIFTAILCLVLVLCTVACSKDEENTDLTQSNIIATNDLNVDFKYSANCYEWSEVTAETALFADNTWGSGDVEIVYLNIKNLDNVFIACKLSLNLSGSAEGATFGIVENKRVAYSDKNSAVADISGKSHDLTSGYTFTQVIKPELSSTFALVVNLPDGASGGECNIGVNFTATAVPDSGSENTSVRQDGRLAVFADAYVVANDTAVKTELKNLDGSFVATLAENTVSQGALVTATVKPTETADTESAYDITLLNDGNAYSGSASISLLVGYGLNGVTVTYGGAEIAGSSYNKDTGVLQFAFVSNGSYTVKYADDSRTVGVTVTGSDRLFASLDAATDYICDKASDIPTDITYIIYGEVPYTVAEGQALSFVDKLSSTNSITVAGANKTAKIVITADSGSLPSLPTANDSAKIYYNNLIFDSEKTEDTKHFDYRGNSDISFRNCVFERALSTRGPKSNVVVDHCEFNAELYEDTYVGYCYYSITVSGDGSAITVDFTNNNVTGSWGGINLDWESAAYYVAGNTFSGFNCSKPAIQLSRANTMLIENNVFKDITDENALRFYKAYGAQDTTIINNTFDVDYLLHCDNSGAIDNYKNFTFEENIISSTTNIVLGHVTNDAPEVTREHGYVVDTDLNTIQ